jgi:hypothetical protein
MVSELSCTLSVCCVKLILMSFQEYVFVVQIFCSSLSVLVLCGGSTWGNILWSRDRNVEDRRAGLTTECKSDVGTLGQHQLWMVERIALEGSGSGLRARVTSEDTRVVSKGIHPPKVTLGVYKCFCTSVLFEKCALACALFFLALHPSNTILLLIHFQLIKLILLSLFLLLYYHRIFLMTL